MAAAAAARKRPAPDGASPAPAGNKRARYNFSNISDYELLEELGQGSYGVVVKGRVRRTGETVAVKWIRGADEYGCGAPDLGAVVREAGCLGACRGHPSIVQIKDVATDKTTGHLFIVMEFVGPSLRDRLTRPFSEAETRAFMRQLLGGAVKMHGSRMVHRDIKPENILVGADGKLKICDFGFATPTKPLGTPYPEEFVGTMLYCAPEQLMGSRFYGPAVDMWALGCVMAELLIGMPLFTARTEEGMLEQISDLHDGISSMGLQAFEDLLELSMAGRELLASLLSFNSGERLTAEEALKHRWFKEEEKKPMMAARALCPGFVPLFSAA